MFIEKRLVVLCSLAASGGGGGAVTESNAAAVCIWGARLMMRRISIDEHNAIELADK